MIEKKGKGRGIKGVLTNVYEGVPDLMVKVDGVKAANFGLTATDVERQMRAIFMGQEATKVRESALRITDVDVRYSNALRFGTRRFDPEIVRGQLILLPEAAVPKPAKGGLFQSLAGPKRAVPLSAVATIETIRTPDEQVRENQQPLIIVTTQLAEEEAGLGSVIADIRGWMAERGPLPSGYRWELGGHYIWQQEAFYSLTIVMVVAIMLVFIMLAIQFRSVMLPLLIFLTQPLSLVSGLFALWVTHTPLNISSYMGAILLIGLDMKNGILLVEYIQQLRAEGMELRPALQLAGAHPFPPDSDDEFGRDPRSVAPGTGYRPRSADAATVGYHGHRRLDGQYALHPHGDPGWLFGPGKRQTSRPVGVILQGDEQCRCARWAFWALP